VVLLILRAPGISRKWKRGDLEVGIHRRIHGIAGFEGLVLAYPLCLVDSPKTSDNIP